MTDKEERTTEGPAEGTTPHMGLPLLDPSADLPVYGAGIYGGGPPKLAVVPQPESEVP